MVLKGNIKTIEDLKQFLRVFFKDTDVKIYLFGSRAEKRNSQFSDVDLAFETDKDIDKLLSKLRYILDESNLPYKVDIVDLKYAPYLKDVVKEKGERWL